MSKKISYLTQIIQFSRNFIKMLKNPAGERNKQPILEILQQYVDVNKESRLLEISSGCGLHSSFLSSYFPMTSFQPSECDVNLFKSIKAYTKDCRNVKEPILIDISKDHESWDSAYEGQLLKSSTNIFEYMLNINMIHITPFECTEGLFKNSSKLLKSKGLLFTYGPYSMNNVLTPESNVLFDKSLRSKDPSWGIRDICDLKLLAEKNSMDLLKIHDLPSNNKLLVWIKN
ncbi:UPF0585 protein CG18661 [Chironomus tepperi]|uniref:UPF0585 protein CG18661 n=1 Tax=Chironomus tepperi TaxID=113505 RepID=UPI00391F87F6